MLLVVSLVSLAAAALRVPTRSHFPEAWDPANFALALDRIDLPAHQPHPPAAIGYVLAGRLALAVTGDANLALVAINLLLTVLAGPLLFAFAFHASQADQARHGWLALVALVGSPLFWFYGCVAEIYVAETVLGLLVAYCCLRTAQGRQGYAVGAGLALALLGAFRVTGAAFLLPLFTLTLARSRSRRIATLGLAALVLATASWAVPFLVWASPETYARVLVDHFARTARPTSLFGGGTARILQRALRDMLQALIAGVGLFNAAALPVFVLLRRPRLVPGRGLAAFAALWAIPGLLFYLLVHMAKPGYVLPSLPVAWLALAFLYGQEPRAVLRVALAAAQLLTGAWQFLAAGPATGDAIGEGVKYSQKSGLQKARVELNSVLQTTRAAILLSDRQIEALDRELRASCPGAAGIVLVGRDHQGPSWRKLMYVFPEAASVRLPANPGDAWMVASGRRITAVEDGELSLPEVCRTYWVDPPPAVVDEARRHAELHRVQTGTMGLYWTRGPVSVPLEGRLRLTLR